MAKAKGKRNHRKEKLEFVQDYLPIRDLKNGIIETTDNRYIKILEIEPINFTLRSDEEQFNIISSFASWLKISPMRLQFKSITRRADSDKHISMICEELEHEENPQCKELGEDYIGLIKDVGNREALTRRFFLIFQYEAVGRNESDDYAKIYGMLQTAEQTARAYFMQCGNSIVQSKDPDEATAEILYMFYNRRSCTDEPFSSRVDRIVVDTMAAKKKIIGMDPVPPIRMTNFLAPRGIDLSHYNYVVMDGLYYSFLYIKAGGYPSRVRAGWMSSLINAGEGVDIDVHLRRENRSRTIDKVAQRIRLNRTKLKSMQDTSTDYEELTNSIQAGYFIKNGIANYNEDLFYMSVFITVSAKTYEELLWRKQQMVDMLKSMDMYTSECSFQQEAALQSVMPFLKISPKLEKKAQRNVLTSGAASSYIFTSFELSDDNGVLLGINRYNNSLCIVDLFNTKINKNANLNLLGTSGAGKTFTMQLLALRMRMRGIQCYILAPIKGHEFRRACNKIGGEFIKIAPGSPHCINVMEIRHGSTDQSEQRVLAWNDRFRNAGIRLVYVSQENKGLGGAINAGLKHVTGEYLSLIDIDDELLESAVSTRVAFLKSHPDIDVVRSNGWYNRKSGKSLFIYDEKEKRIDDVFSALVGGETNNWAGSYMVRTSALFDFYPDREIYQSRFGQNLQFLMPLTYKKKCGYIDEPQMIYNIQEDSLSKTSDIKKTEKILSDNLAGYRDIRIYLIEKIIKTPNESERYIRIVDIAYYRSLLKLAIDTRDEQLLKATYSNLKELSGVTINERIEYCQYFFPYMVFPLRCIRKIKTAIDTLRETL